MLILRWWCASKDPREVGQCVGLLLPACAPWRGTKRTPPRYCCAIRFFDPCRLGGTLTTPVTTPQTKAALTVITNSRKHAPRSVGINWSKQVSASSHRCILRSVLILFVLSSGVDRRAESFGRLREPHSLIEPAVHTCGVRVLRVRTHDNSLGRRAESIAVQSIIHR